jgi:hypothetical protein
MGHFADGALSIYADANWQHHDNKRARKTPELWVAPGFAERSMGASVVVGNIRERSPAFFRLQYSSSPQNTRHFGNLKCLGVMTTRVASMKSDQTPGHPLNSFSFSTFLLHPITR